MEIVRVPEATGQQPQIQAGDISFVDYRDHGGIFRNRVLFDLYAFSFVQNGQKQIYRAAGNTVLAPGQGMLIPEGNSLIAEHSDNSERYHSVIIFFPGSLGREFMALRKSPSGGECSRVPFIHFKTNAYLQEYVRNIRMLISGHQKLSREMAVLKVRELLTAMFELAPQLLSAFFTQGENHTLMSVVENNLMKSLTLEELAFLSHRSLSSFKRDFMAAYGLPPQKYIREKRLEMACSEIVKGRLASEVYLDYGYQHVSNFIAAFKRRYGVTPAGYRRLS